MSMGLVARMVAYPRIHPLHRHPLCCFLLVLSARYVVLLECARPLTARALRLLELVPSFA